MVELEITGFAVFRDEDDNLSIVECERVPSSGKDSAPDPKVLEEARRKLRESRSSDTDVA